MEVGGDWRGYGGGREKVFERRPTDDRRVRSANPICRSGTLRNECSPSKESRQTRRSSRRRIPAMISLRYLVPPKISRRSLAEHDSDTDRRVAIPNQSRTAVVGGAVASV